MNYNNNDKCNEKNVSVHPDERWRSVNSGAKHVLCAPTVWAVYQQLNGYLWPVCCAEKQKESTELFKEDTFYLNFNMSQHQFNGILAIVKEDISEDKTNFRDPISTKE